MFHSEISSTKETKAEAGVFSCGAGSGYGGGLQGGAQPAVSSMHMHVRVQDVPMLMHFSNVCSEAILAC